jgi:hypothetical protein
MRSAGESAGTRTALNCIYPKVRTVKDDSQMRSVGEAQSMRTIPGSQKAWLVGRGTVPRSKHRAGQRERSLIAASTKEEDITYWQWEQAYI